MVATDNRSACAFQSGLASSRRAMKTAERENRNCWTASIRADGAAGQNTPSLIAWGWKQEKFQRWGKCFLLTSPSIERICHKTRPVREGPLNFRITVHGACAAHFGRQRDRGQLLHPAPHE